MVCPIFKQTRSSDVRGSKEFSDSQSGWTEQQDVGVISSYSHSHQDTVANVTKIHKVSTSPNSLALVLCELLVFLAKQKV